MSNDDDDKTHTHVTLTSGTMVSHYRIVEKIGAGGMGEVYLAEDTKLKRQVALKFLPSHLCQDKDCRKRFTREAQAAAKLDHPNVVTIYEVGEFNQRPFFAMQLVEGKSLKDIIKDKDISLDQVIDLTIQICQGLNKAHQSSITHRDIKPSNIVIDADGRPKLLDFGLAAVEGIKHITKTGSTLGTVGYMSPEQIQGKDVDQRSDLFSFGVVLYEMVTARLPFVGDNETSVMNAVLNEAVEPLSRYKSEVPDELQNIVSKLLEKDRELRYQHADDVISDLKRLRRDSDSSIITHTVTTQTRKTSRFLIPSLIVLLVVASLILKPWEFKREASSDAVADSNRLAIMYFDNLADPADSQKMGEIATNLLITDLSESRYVQVVSSQRLYDILKMLGREGEKKIDRGVASQIAERAKAKWMLHGNILRTDPQIVITAELTDVSSGTSVATQRIDGEPGEDIFALVDRLTVEIKSDLSLPEEALTEPDRPVADVTTHSPEAYRYYLEGVDAGFKHYYSEAEINLKKAIQIDSTFAMAYYRLAGLNSGADRREYATTALRLSDRVSRGERLTIESFHAFVTGDLETAVEKSVERLRLYPDDKEICQNIAYLYQYGLRQTDSAIHYYNKALELDSLYEAVYNSLAYCYNNIGDFDKSIWAINKYIELAPDQANPYDSRGELYASAGKIDEAIASFEKAVEIKPDFYPSWESLGHMYVYKREYDEARRCYEKLLESPRRDTRRDGRRGLSLIPMHQGRFQDALSIIEQGVAADRIEKVEAWEKLATPSMIHAEFGAIDAAIETMQQASDDFVENQGPLVPFHHFDIQMLAENGRMAEAEKELAAWKDIIEQNDTTFMAFYYIGAGCVERAKGNYDAAIRHFTGAAKVFLDRRSPFGFRSRLMLAQIYQDNGQLGEAVTKYEHLLSNYGEGRLLWTIESVKLHYYLGTAYEESGWNDKAISEYETFLDIWKNADSGLAAMEDTRERLARLKIAP